MNDEILAEILTKIGDREQRFNRKMESMRDMAQSFLHAGNKDQAAVYDASALVFRRLRDEFARLKLDVEKIITRTRVLQEQRDSDGLNEWAVSIFDENASHADPIQEFQTGGDNALSEAMVWATGFAQKPEYKLTQLRIVVMRIM